MNVNRYMILTCKYFCITLKEIIYRLETFIISHLNKTKAFSFLSVCDGSFRLLSFIHLFDRRHIMLRSWRFIFNTKRNNINVGFDKIENEWENQMILLDILFYIEMRFCRPRLVIDWIWCYWIESYMQPGNIASILIKIS